MDLLIPICLACSTGLLTAAQGPTNAALGARTGAVQASLVSFAGGTIILVLLSAFIGQGDFFAFTQVPLWQCLGGVYGAFIVFSMAYCTPSLGIALCLTLFMLGQLIGGMFIDGLGLLGVAAVEVSRLRVAGCLLAFVGILVVYAGRKRQDVREARAREGATGQDSASSAAFGGKPLMTVLADAAEGVKSQGFSAYVKQVVSRKSTVSPVCVLLSFAGGLASAVQTPTNAALSQVTGTLEASTLNFCIGFAVLLVVALATTKGHLASMRGLAPWKFLGGLYGALGVPALTAATPALGVSLALGFLMVSQLVGALFVDAFGWFETKKIPVDNLRVVGAVVLGAGVILVTISRMV